MLRTNWSTSCTQHTTLGSDHWVSPVPRPLPDFISLLFSKAAIASSPGPAQKFLGGAWGRGYGCEIKSGSGLGTRLHWAYTDRQLFGTGSGARPALTMDIRARVSNFMAYLHAEDLEAMHEIIFLTLSSWIMWPQHIYHEFFLLMSIIYLLPMTMIPTELKLLMITYLYVSSWVIVICLLLYFHHWLWLVMVLLLGLEHV